jgi:hypothetical protein
MMTRGERPAAPLVVDTYGATYGITRHAIINDETNELLNSAPTEMGDAAAEFIVETVIALIESNPTAPDGNPFFSVGRGNQGTAALSRGCPRVGGVEDDEAARRHGSAHPRHGRVAGRR